MLNTKIQNQGFLGSVEEDFLVSVFFFFFCFFFWPYMDMAAILLNGAEQSEQIYNFSFTKDPMWNLVKTGQAVSEKKTLKDYARHV